MVKKLEQRLNLSGVVSISIAAMLGSGIFVLPGIAVIYAGSQTWLAYLVSALCVLPAALSKAELATAMPTSGGTYVYIERTFGPLAGTIAGLGLCLSLLLKSAFALVGFGAYLAVVASVPLQLTAVILLSLIIALNIFGIGKVSGSLVFFTVVSLASLVVLAVYGGFSVEQTNIEMALPKGTGGFWVATSLVFVSFAGVTKVAAIAEEIKNPGVNLPRGILISLALVTVVYCAINFVLTGVIPAFELENDLKPVYTLAFYLGGEWFGFVAAIVGVITMTSMANAGILAASRFPFAMGRDALLPGVFGRLHSRYLTPVWSILICGMVMFLAILLLDVTKIAKIASSFMIMIYLTECIAVIVLRETRVQWYQPEYLSAFYPWTQLFGIFTCSALLIFMGYFGLLAFVGIAIPGFLLYLLYGRGRTSRRGVIGIRGKQKISDSRPSEFQEPATVERFESNIKANVMVALFGKEKSAETLVEVGMALAEDEKLEVIHLLEVPEQTDLSDIREETAVVRSLRRRFAAMSERYDKQVNFDPIISHDIFEAAYDVSERVNCAWFVTEWGGRSRGTFTIHNPLGWLRDHLSCNLVTFRDAGVRHFRKIMVLLSDNKNDTLVLDIADHLAKINNAEVTIVSFLDQNVSEKRVTDEMNYLNMSKEFCDNSTEVVILQGKDKVQTLLAATIEFDLLVFGIPDKSNFWHQNFGSDYDRLTANAACSVMSLQKGVLADEQISPQV